VDVGAERAGIGWCELRRTGAGPWTVQQEGTFAPADGNRDERSRSLCAQLTSPSKRPTAKTTIIVAILGSARNIFSISMRSPLNGTLPMR
jgi:hypothetical protein